MKIRFRSKRLVAISAAIGLIVMMTPVFAAGSGVDKEGKPLESWQSLQLRIYRDGKWRNFGFGTLEVHKQGIVHRGKTDTAIAWEHILESKLHPLDNRVDMTLANPEGRLQLLTMLNWIRFDFERMFRDLERYREELTPVPNTEDTRQSAESSDARREIRM